MTKKEKIDLTARELFWKHGFKKVSIDEICRKAGVSRKTYYTYYSNKSALVVFLLEDITDKMFTMYDALINDETKSMSDKMQEMLNMKFQMNQDFSLEFVSDFFHPDSADVLEYFNKIVAKSLEMTRKFFVDAQEKGEMNPDLNIDFVMWNLQKQLEICSAPEVIAMFPDAESMSRQISELLIYGIMPPK